MNLPGMLGVTCLVLAVGRAHAQVPDVPPAPPTAAATPPTDAKDGRPSDFARFVATADGGHFDTAITTYRNQDGVEVVLYAAVHVADGGCYELLQGRFERHEALLYELVGPEDYRPRRGDERGSSFIAVLQQGIKNGLELEFQLDGIDYAAENFVHADMTPQEFQASMDERGESLFGMLIQVGLRAQAAQMASAEQAADDDADAAGDRPASRGGEFDLIRAFRNGEGRHQMRLLMAQQLEGMEAAAAGGEGSTLLEGRNEKCLEVLQREIGAGRRKLGVYYGGAHLTHMEQRLCDDLGFAKVDHEWIVAWDCTKRPDPKFDRELYVQRRRAIADVADLAAAAQRWQQEHGEAPTLAELQQERDGKACWTGATADPWGHPYQIDGYQRAPFVDVHSAGQDGVAGTPDDIHSASARELRRMKRAQ